MFIMVRDHSRDHSDVTPYLVIPILLNSPPSVAHYPYELRFDTGTRLPPFRQAYILPCVVSAKLEASRNAY